MYKSLFDDYVWKSRILVGILVCLPVILITPWTLKLLVPEANPWISNPVVVAAILAVISAVVRRLGLIAERPSWKNGAGTRPPLLCGGQMGIKAMNGSGIFIYW